MKKHPGKILCTMAYRFTEKPPRTVRPRDNVYVQMCPIDICLAHPLDRCRDDTGARYYGDLVGWSSMTSAQFLEHLDGWAKLTDRLFIWHYSTDFQHLLMPFSDFRQTAANVRIYRQHGVMRRRLDEALALVGDDKNALYYIRKNSLPVRYLEYLLGTDRLEVKDGAYRPVGAWRLEGVAKGLSVAHRFEAQEVESCWLTFDTARRVAVMEIRSPARTLAKDDRITIHQTWEVNGR